MKIKAKNYLIIVYLVKKFIQSLKSYLTVKKILKIKPFHLNMINDLTSFYKDGNDIGNSNALKRDPTNLKFNNFVNFY